MKQESMNKPPAPQMKATYWGPGTAAQYAAGSAGLHWPHQEKLPLALFFFSFVNVLTVSEAQTNL